MPNLCTQGADCPGTHWINLMHWLGASCLASDAEPLRQLWEQRFRRERFRPFARLCCIVAASLVTVGVAAFMFGHARVAGACAGGILIIGAMAVLEYMVLERTHIIVPPEGGGRYWVPFALFELNRDVDDVRKENWVEVQLLLHALETERDPERLASEIHRVLARPQFPLSRVATVLRAWLACPTSWEQRTTWTRHCSKGRTLWDEAQQYLAVR